MAKRKGRWFLSSLQDHQRRIALSYREYAFNQGLNKIVTWRLLEGEFDTKR